MIKVNITNMKRIAENNMKKIIILILIFIFIPIPIKVFATLPLSGKVILIDAGHGEFDPGKIGDGDVLEKDINLKISLKLQSMLEMADAYVLLTRSEDKALGDTKNKDMQGRRYISNISEADVLLSIHQNAFTTPKPSGAIVFYYNEKGTSKILANYIQKYMGEDLERSSGREARKNTSYYILRKTTIPAILIECGFLTNPQDLNLLKTDEYQEKVALAIYKGLVDYFNYQYELEEAK
ncbi:MAG: N-acetylmuramoyl-L-alanine amidase [Defluviitaleaceae bacterium]|nr:N-acetylmuramoyl-L-alanine amidase [Defluviitaleaceae bacterium]